MTRIICAGIAAALVVGTAVGAEAEEPAFEIGAAPVWFLLGGLSGGATFAVDEGGATAGGELSLVRLNEGRFAGFYADAVYDFGAAGTYLSAGPEIGLHLRGGISFPISFGVDGGAALRFQDETELGATGRVFVALFGVFSIYGRYAHFGSDDGDRAFQAGAMLKFPLSSPFGRGAID